MKMCCDARGMGSKQGWVVLTSEIFGLNSKRQSRQSLLTPYPAGLTGYQGFESTIEGSVPFFSAVDPSCHSSRSNDPFGFEGVPIPRIGFVPIPFRQPQCGLQAGPSSRASRVTGCDIRSRLPRAHSFFTDENEGEWIALQT